MKQKLKCYISAPSNFDLTKIETVLAKLKIEHYNFFDFSIGTTFSDLIFRKIRESDFVISILTSDNANVLFELGVADGLRKPLFILIDKEFKVPFFLEKKIYFQTKFEDTKMIELALANFIVDIKAKAPRPKKAKEKKEFLSIDETNELVQDISHLRKNPIEREVFDLIKDTFSKLNIDNTSISEVTRDNGVDLIIRSKELTPYFGNPIFIEIIAGALNQTRFNDVQEQMQKYISRTEIKGGIILYLDRNNKRFFPPLKYPFILYFDLEDFILGIVSEGLVKFLINKRNAIAHGTW